MTETFPPVGPRPGRGRSQTPRRRPVIAVASAVVAVVLLGGSWALTTRLRDQAQAASTKVVAVTRATAQLSKLANEEDQFFTGVAAYSFNFRSALARVVVAVNAIKDPQADAPLRAFVTATRRVVKLVDQGDSLGAARAEVSVQAPANYALVAECNRYAATQSARAESTLARASNLSEAVDLGALFLLAVLLGIFWYLDARADRERHQEVERTEARYRGIVARGSDAVWLVDENGAILFASESTKGVLGVDVDEAKRPLFVDLFPDAERESLREALTDVVSDPTRPVTVAASVAEPDKRYLEVVLTNKCADDAISAVVVSVRDLTERHRAETALERSEAMIQDLIDHTPALVYVKDLDDHYLRVNKAWSRHMGRSAAETIGATPAELFSTANAQAITAADHLTFERGPYEAELNLEFEGRRRTFLASRFPLLDTAGRPYAVGGVSIDISDRVREEDFERTLGAMVTASGDAIFTTSHGEIVFWNDAAAQLLGYASGDVLGSPTTRLTPADYRDHHQRLWDKVGAGQTVQAAETKFLRKDGTLIDVEVTLTPQRDENAAVSGVSVIIRDATERRARHDELSRQARTDSLTGLPNRAALTAHLARVVSRSAFDGSTAALLFFDLDHFKEVNDTYLHAAGDELLRVTAQRARAVLRPGDFVARLGGDEFVAVCYPVRGRADAEEIGRRLADAVAAPVAVGAELLGATASVGLALTPVSDAVTWLAQGDAAMYRAKREGRDRIVVFVEGMAIESPDRSWNP
ncbi:MAG TPA: PAS domain S-box protein [Acidimicrobiales bacterium]|nr:PAS domain S-box protein [Acidimicrobiales bacterium]